MKKASTAFLTIQVYVDRYSQVLSTLLVSHWAKQERTPVQKTGTNVKKILCLSWYVLLHDLARKPQEVVQQSSAREGTFARWIAWLCAIQTGTDICLVWLQQRRSGLSALVWTNIPTVALLLRGNWCSRDCPESLYVTLHCVFKLTPELGQNTIILGLPFCRHSWFPLLFVLNSCELVLSQTSCIYNPNKRGKSEKMGWGLQNMPNEQ